MANLTKEQIKIEVGNALFKAWKKYPTLAEKRNILKKCRDGSDPDTFATLEKLLLIPHKKAKLRYSLAA